jgi:hypothetical protein
MDLSPGSVAGGSAVVVVAVITMRGFFRDAPKAENGFIFAGIISSHPRRRNIRRKTAMISDLSHRRSKRLWQAPFASKAYRAQHIVMWAPHALHMHFTFLC